MFQFGNCNAVYHLHWLWNILHHGIKFTALAHTLKLHLPLWVFIRSADWINNTDRPTDKSWYQRTKYYSYNDLGFYWFHTKFPLCKNSSHLLNFTIFDCIFNKMHAVSLCFRKFSILHFCFRIFYRTYFRFFCCK